MWAKGKKRLLLGAGKGKGGLTQVAAKSTKLGQNEAFFARKWCVLGNLKI